MHRSCSEEYRKNKPIIITLMRKIIVCEFITLDGVMQAPGGPEEDASGSFKYGGWTAPYMDEASGKIMVGQMKPMDYLLGRKTFDIFAGYWPQHANVWPGINEGVKYVLSRTLKTSDWKNTVFIESVEDIKKLKNSKGLNLQVWGSSQLVQLLLKNDLVDELWLKTFPIALGTGKKLWGDGTIPAAFTLTESFITSKGVIFATYARVGEVKTGTVGE
jgi:dihydrofolate reductase